MEISHSNSVKFEKTRKTYENNHIYLKLTKSKNQEKPIYSSIYVSGFSKNENLLLNLNTTRKGGVLHIK